MLQMHHAQPFFAPYPNLSSHPYFLLTSEPLTNNRYTFFRWIVTGGILYSFMNIQLMMSLCMFFSTLLTFGLVMNRTLAGLISTFCLNGVCLGMIEAGKCVISSPNITTFSPFKGFFFDYRLCSRSNISLSLSSIPLKLPPFSFLSIMLFEVYPFPSSSISFFLAMSSVLSCREENESEMIRRDSKMKVHHASEKRGCIKGRKSKRDRMSEGGDEEKKEECSFYSWPLHSLSLSFLWWKLMIFLPSQELKKRVTEYFCFLSEMKQKMG